MRGIPILALLSMGLGLFSVSGQTASAVAHRSSQTFAVTEDVPTPPQQADKIHQLLSSYRPGPSTKQRIFVAFLRGNLVFDGLNNPEAGNLAIEILTAVGLKRNYEVIGDNKWWNLQANLCQTILDAKPDRIVVIGHSAGSNGSRVLAKCLKEGGRKIDSLITVVAFDTSEPVSEENVIAHFNYVIKETWPAGSEKESNGFTKTKNFFAKAPGDEWAHLNCTTHLAPLFALQTLAELEGLEQYITIPEDFSYLESEENLERFFRKKN